MESLQGKVAVITGASSGIGTGIALYFAKQGIRLSLGGRKQNNLEAVAKSTGLPDDKILTTVGDIAKKEDRQNLIDRTIEKFGRLDVLINNAGMILTSLLADITEEQYDAIFDVNVKAQIFLTKLAIPHLIRTKGSIVNISSAGTSMLCKYEGLYSMSKIALDAYTKTLAAVAICALARRFTTFPVGNEATKVKLVFGAVSELGPKGVRVNSINPGLVPTNIYLRSNAPEEAQSAESWAKATPLQRSGTPEEIAKAAAFLASDMSSFVTGELLFADGGLRLGASSGIGSGIALYFAKHGVRLSLAGRKQNNLEAVAESTGLPTEDILTTVGDIVKEEDRQNLIDKTIEKFGRLDILVNNAGIVEFSFLADITEEHYNNIIDINLKAHVFLTRLAIPYLIETKGNIVNISSMATAVLGTSLGIYSMSKVALNAYTKTLAKEIGPKGVRVNSINPGFITTNIFERSNMSSFTDIESSLESFAKVTPLRRIGTVEEIAKVTAFVASDMASFVTGEVIFADGGVQLGTF